MQGLILWTLLQVQHQANLPKPPEYYVAGGICVLIFISFLIAAMNIHRLTDQK